MKIERFQIITIAVALATAIIPFIGQARGNYPDPSNSRKADYMYMEALRQKALENYTGYFTLLQRAYALDTSQTFLANDLAFLYLADGNVEEGMRLFQRHFDAAPADYYSTMTYAQMAERLGYDDAALKGWATLDSLYPNRPEIVMRHADALARGGDSTDIRRAVTMLDNLELAIGKNINVATQKSANLYSLGDTAALMAEVNDVISYAPESSSSYMFAARVFNALNMNDSARVYIDRACDLDDDSGVALAYRAAYLKQHGDSVGYDRDVFYVLANTDLDIERKSELLGDYVKTLYEDTAQRPRITQMFELMLSRNPHNTELRDMYGAYLTLIDSYNEAAEQFTIAQDLDPDNLWRALNVCSNYADAQRYDDVIRVTSDFISRFPEEPYLHSYRAAAFNMKEQYDSARVEFEHAIDIVKDNNPQLHSSFTSSIGDVLYAKGDTLGAYAMYDKALDIYSENALALNNYAYFLALSGEDLDRAESMSSRAVTLNPGSATTLDTYAWVLFLKKDYAKARDYIDRAMAAGDSDEAEIYSHAGDIYFFNGEIDKAVDFWKHALQLDPDDSLLARKVAHGTYFYK